MLRRLMRKTEPRTDEAPGRRPSQGRPIDLVHLARQTLGDRELEREILVLMARQVESCEARIDLAVASERRALAHALKGAAANIGAFPLAEAAQGVEDEPTCDTRLLAMRTEMRRASAFIQTIAG